MTTYYKLFNKQQGLVMSPEKQFFGDASAKTLLDAGVLFSSKDEASKVAEGFISPRFIPVKVTA